MEVQLTETQNNLIRNVARKEGFVDYELVTEAGTIKGDNYLGVITTVSIKSQEKELNLILKSSSSNEKLRQMAPIKLLFLREIYLYEHVFPAFSKFQEEQGLADGFSAYAKIYGSFDQEPEECLVLENLRPKDYKIWNRRVPMNSDHVALVFTEYGKFHAVSLAIRDKKPEVYEKLTEDLFSIFVKTSSVEQRLVDIANNLKNGYKVLEGNSLALEAFERFALAITEFVREDLSFPEEKIVVTHGDCWCNNLMFKYEDPQDNKKPTELRILDWQISATGSPVMDLAYFFFVCSPKEVLLDYRKYLKIYHDSVCRSLKGLSCDPETVFPFSLLEYHWKKYAKYGLYIALMLIKLMLGDVEEVPDMTEIAESGKSFADGFNFDSVHNNDYNQRILDIVTMMAENNLI